MTISEIVRKLNLEVFSRGSGETEIRGVIVGDLLSFIMAEARENWAWVTIQVHLNVCAVAVLKDVPLVLIASGRKPARDLADRCEAEGITLAGTSLSAYEVSGLLYGMKAGGAA